LFILGFGSLKYTCPKVLNYQLYDREKKKTVPHQFSNEVVPPLSNEEIKFLFPTTITDPVELSLYESEIRSYGYKLPWKCGGDGTFFGRKSRQNYLALWFPEWARSCGKLGTSQTSCFIFILLCLLLNKLISYQSSNLFVFIFV
jgi:hypothetical protein